MSINLSTCNAHNFKERCLNRSRNNYQLLETVKGQQQTVAEYSEIFRKLQTNVTMQTMLIFNIMQKQEMEQATYQQFS
jgi:hypothetical protein